MSLLLFLHSVFCFVFSLAHKEAILHNVFEFEVISHIICVKTKKNKQKKEEKKRKVIAHILCS
jgi:hypothetical protein